MNKLQLKQLCRHFKFPQSGTVAQLKNNLKDIGSTDYVVGIMKEYKYQVCCPTCSNVFYSNSEINKCSNCKEESKTHKNFFHPSFIKAKGKKKILTVKESKIENVVNKALSTTNFITNIINLGVESKIEGKCISVKDDGNKCDKKAKFDNNTHCGRHKDKSDDKQKGEKKESKKELNEEKPKKKKKKDTIPKPLRDNVWQTYMKNVAEGKCMCCDNNIIKMTNFECGHILSEKNGGEVNLENLRPICKRCNGSMGTEHMAEYQERLFGLNTIRSTMKESKIITSKIPQQVKDEIKTLRNKITNIEQQQILDVLLEDKYYNLFKSLIEVHPNSKIKVGKTIEIVSDKMEIM